MLVNSSHYRLRSRWQVLRRLREDYQESYTPDYACQPLPSVRCMHAHWKSATVLIMVVQPSWRCGAVELFLATTWCVLCYVSVNPRDKGALGFSGSFGGVQTSTMSTAALLGSRRSGCKRQTGLDDAGFERERLHCIAEVERQRDPFSLGFRLPSRLWCLACKMSTSEVQSCRVTLDATQFDSMQKKKAGQCAAVLFVLFEALVGGPAVESNG